MRRSSHVKVLEWLPFLVSAPASVSNRVTSPLSSGPILCRGDDGMEEIRDIRNLKKALYRARPKDGPYQLMVFEDSEEEW
jgi:hypothetical protein